MSLSNILQALIAESKLSEAEMARQMNLPTATLNKLKTGAITDPRSSTLTIIAKYFHLSIDQLLGMAPIHRTKVFTYLPLLSADQITTIDISQLNYINHQQWITYESSVPIEPNQLFAMHNDSEAMVPYFDTNDTFIIDKTQIPQNKQFVLAAINNNTTIIVRQLLLDARQTMLVAVNKLFSAVTLTATDYIIGVVIYSLRRNA